MRRNEVTPLPPSLSRPKFELGALLCATWSAGLGGVPQKATVYYMVTEDDKWVNLHTGVIVPPLTMGYVVTEVDGVTIKKG